MDGKILNFDKLKFFHFQLENELKENILPFWIENDIDIENGGFYGYISNDLNINKESDKGAVLYSRILWTYSKAYGFYKEEKYLTMAARAYYYILEHFWDNEYSGVYWMLDARGEVVDPKKKIYAIAFTLYGLSEFYRVTGNKESLDRAIELFEVIERYACDKENKGYIDAFSRDWSLLDDMRLGEKDMNAIKSMNTHLHVLEAYTNLLREWDSAELKNKLRELLVVIMDYVIDPKNYSFKLFFDEFWDPKSDIVSFGHDIEGSWLLYEAAEILGDKDIMDRVGPTILKMAEHVYDKGIDIENGGLYNEARGEQVKDTDKHWWPQAEALIGFFNAYRLSNKELFLDACFNVWNFINRYIIDKVNGEWFWRVSRSGEVYKEDEKVGPWKCPYHNSRACFEVMSRIDEMLLKEG
jgi:mannobiose 2-epimerase